MPSTLHTSSPRTFSAEASLMTQSKKLANERRRSPLSSILVIPYILRDPSSFFLRSLSPFPMRQLKFVPLIETNNERQWIGS